MIEGDLFSAVKLSHNSAWDLDTFAYLCSMIGDGKSNSIAKRFFIDLERRFLDLENHDSLRRDAHAIKSTAGMLGFTSLAEAAARMENACEIGEQVDECLATLAAEKQNARLAFDDRINPLQLA